MKVKFVYIIFFVALMPLYTYAQINVERDNNGNIIKEVYASGMTISYSYDEAGNRISQIVSTIITAVSNLNDSLIQANNGVFIYPNPSNGNFKSRIYSSQKQQVIVQIYSIDGKLIHTYTAEVLKGYYDINISISPKPASGTYIVSVKGKTMNASKQIVITE